MKRWNSRYGRWAKYINTVIDLHGNRQALSPFPYCFDEARQTPFCTECALRTEKLLAFFRRTVHEWVVIVTIDLRNSSNLPCGVTVVGDEAHESMT
jgi:hypothetical protein